VSRPVAVAITGGIGAGKSEALAAFARHGAATISSDEVVHRLLAEDEEVREAVREKLGESVFDGDGQIDRARVAERVFGDRELLAWLEGLLHPLVSREYLVWRERQTAPLTVTEVPLLYEVGGQTRFDKVVVITAPQEVREARRGRSDDREARLVPEAEKVQRGDYVYVNTGSLDDLDRFVAGVVEELTRSS
jgi:dephospho-CoA kinase